MAANPLILLIIAIAVIGIIGVGLVMSSDSDSGSSAGPDATDDETNEIAKIYLSKNECPTGFEQVPGQFGILGSNDAPLPFVRGGSAGWAGWSWFHPFLCKGPQSRAQNLYKFAASSPNSLGLAGILSHSSQTTPFTAGSWAFEGKEWKYVHPHIVRADDNTSTESMTVEQAPGLYGWIADKLALADGTVGKKGNKYNADWTWVHPNLLAD